LFEQTLKRIDGSKLNEDSLSNRFEHLMTVANVSGVAVSVFNNNYPVYTKTFGYADVQKKIPLAKRQYSTRLWFRCWCFSYALWQGIF